MSINHYEVLKQEITDFMEEKGLSYRKLAFLLNTSGQNLHGRMQKDHSPDLELMHKFYDLRKVYAPPVETTIPEVDLDDLE